MPIALVLLARLAWARLGAVGAPPSQFVSLVNQRLAGLPGAITCVVPQGALGMILPTILRASLVCQKLREFLCAQHVTCLLTHGVSPVIFKRPVGLRQVIGLHHGTHSPRNPAHRSP